MSESLLKGRLHGILGVFPRGGNAPRNEEDPLLVTFDQNIERLPIPVFGGSNKLHVRFPRRIVHSSNHSFVSVDVAQQFGFRTAANSSFHPLLPLFFNCSSTYLI